MELEHLLDGRADQRFQVLLTPALRTTAEDVARRRQISLGQLIRQALAADVRRWLREQECTGIAAQWCPLCGPCTCSSESRAQHEYDDPECPLHGQETEHCSAERARA